MNFYRSSEREAQLQHHRDARRVRRLQWVDRATQMLTHAEDALDRAKLGASSTAYQIRVTLAELAVVRVGLERRRSPRPSCKVLSETD